MTGAPTAATVRIEARTESADDTRALAAALAPALAPGDVLLLVGDLGAGKTTFAQGLAAGLGVRDQVTSPTFTLVRPHRCTSPPTAEGRGQGNGPGPTPAPVAVKGYPPVRTMLHADLYRVEGLQEVADLALGEMVEDGAVAVVEWGDLGAPVLGSGALVVRIVMPFVEPADEGGPGEPPHEGEEQRVVTVELPPARAALASELRHRLSRWTRRAGG